MDKNSTTDSTGNNRLLGLTRELDMLSQKAKESTPMAPNPSSEALMQTPEQVQSVVPKQPAPPPAVTAEPGSVSPPSVLPPAPESKGPSGAKKSKVVFWIISIILFLALLGIGAFALLSNGTSGLLNNKSTQTPIPTPLVKTTPVPTPALTPSPTPLGEDGEASSSAMVKDEAKVYCGNPRPDNCPLLSIDPPPYICGSDSVSYSNPCLACANAKLNYYTVSQDVCSPN